jgi:hypothetical protein
MRFLLFVLAISVGIVGIGRRAEAQNYPWCAIYSEGGAGGGTNCGFVTFEQCMETARGLGTAKYAIRASTRIASIGEDKALSILSVPRLASSERQA